MSVLKNEREQGQMEVQTKAFDLVLYTIDNALKEKIVPKRDRWCLGVRLADTALDIQSHIDMANTLRNDDIEEAKERMIEQRLALGSTFRLMTLVHVTRHLTFFDSKVHEYWTELVKEEQTLLRGWMDSDRKKHKRL